MRKLQLDSPADRAWLHRLREESVSPNEIRQDVRQYLQRVREEGDGAVKDLTHRFDGVELDRLRLPDQEDLGR